jgi:hypothetical protein
MRSQGACIVNSLRFPAPLSSRPGQPFRGACQRGLTGSALSSSLFVAIETYVSEASEFTRRQRGNLSIVPPGKIVRGAP